LRHLLQRQLHHDRQIAAYGELGYQITDQLRLTVGERIARTSFELSHYSDGYENYGRQVQWPRSLKRPIRQGQFVLPDGQPESVLRDLRKGFREGGGNAPLPRTATLT